MEENNYGNNSIVQYLMGASRIRYSVLDDFGLSNIIVITLVSFLIGAILSVGLLITKIKKTDEYIPFGPFIVIATFISMYVPFETIRFVLMKIFTLGMYN